MRTRAAFVRGQHARAPNGLEELLRTPGEDRQRIGVEQHGTAGAEHRERALPSLLVDARPGTDQIGGEAPILQQTGQVASARERLTAMLVSAAAYTSSPRTGTAMVVRPAPMRAAARAAMRAAPVVGYPPTSSAASAAVLVVRGPDLGQAMTPEGRSVLPSSRP